MYCSSFTRVATPTLSIMPMLISALAAPASSQSLDSVSSHTQAAAELVDMMRIEEQTVLGLRAGLSRVADDHPASERIAEAITGFLREVALWDTARAEYIRVYQQLFSETELREVIRFYSTPVGRSLLDRSPQLIAATSAAMQQLFAPHLPELERRIIAAMGG